MPRGSKKRKEDKLEDGKSIKGELLKLPISPIIITVLNIQNLPK